MNIDIEKYLKRINYSGELQPTYDTISKLHKLHLFSVPFENLDIHYKKPIELKIEKLYKKIIVDNRGGFCYELNGLFYELLKFLGYDVKRISARVHVKNDEYGPEYDHMALIVKIKDEEYLADVGFGEFILEPLHLRFDSYQDDIRGRFIIKHHHDEYASVNKIENGIIKPVYIFKNSNQELSVFTNMCHYHQTNPNSHFTKNRLISIYTEKGRISISGNTLKIKELDSVVEKQLNNESDFENELWNNFKIKLKNLNL